MRAALALAALTGREIEITDIRAGRSNPGLAPQHLTGVRALAEIADARVEGAELRSRRLRFRPGGLRPGRYAWDVAEETPSAGSVTLVLQAVLPVLALAEGSSRLTIAGGTHVEWSPPVHYARGVLAPALSALGIGLEIELREWGWYPEGGGEISVTVDPIRRPAAAAWEGRGRLTSISGRSVAGSLPSHIARRQAEAARARVREGIGSEGPDPEIEASTVASPGRGTICYLQAGYERSPPAGFTALGRKGRPAEEVGRAAADALLGHHRSGAAVDLHLADQLFPFLALADGTSSFTVPEVSGHLRTVAGLCGGIVGSRHRFHEDPDDGGPARASVEGVSRHDAAPKTRTDGDARDDT